MSDDTQVTNPLRSEVTVFGVRLTPRQLQMIGVIVVAALVGLPFLGLSPYLVGLLTTVALFVCLAGGFNIIAGFTGQLSLGHAIFFGLGAYIAVLLWKDGYTLWGSLFASAGIGIIVAIIIGFITLRLQGLYFAFGTLAASEAISLVFTQLSAVNGATGMNVTNPPHFSETAFYLLSFGLVVLLALTTYVLKHSILGLRLRAIRDDDVKAEAQGIQTWLYKNIAFVVSAFFPAVAGGIFGLYFQHIDPTIFGTTNNINMQLMAVLGGLGTLLGPIIGGAIFYFIFQYAGVFLPDAQLLATGVLLIVIVLYLPEGIVGTVISEHRSSTQKEGLLSNKDRSGSEDGEMR